MPAAISKTARRMSRTFLFIVALIALTLGAVISFAAYAAPY